MSKFDNSDRLFDLISDLPIEKVIGNYITIYRQGDYYDALCPFHNDRHLGSFKITPSLNIYKCFACGEGGNAVKFVKSFFGCTYLAAAIKIAEDFNLLSFNEIEELKSRLEDKDFKKKMTKNMLKKATREIVEEDIASVQQRDKVYRKFLSCLSLNMKDKEHLMKERGLSEDIINKRLYKSLSKNSDVINELLFTEGKLPKLYEKDLIGIPGFYKIKSSNSQFLAWKHMCNNGIIFPLLNEKGEIVSLQIRKSDADAVNRYVFFSSSFAKNRENLLNGTSAKAVIDVLYPEQIKNKTLFITEGRFKAESIIRNFNAVAISFQGVSSYNESELIKCIYEIEKIISRKNNANFTFSNVVIAYDADFVTNKAVKKAAKKLGEFLVNNSHKIISYMIWDINEGKGIDDFIDNNKNLNLQELLSKVKCLTYSQFLEKEGL